MFVAASFAASFSYAQVNVGVASTTNAAVQNSVNLSKAAQATTNAAVTKATATTTAATRGAVSAAATKAGEVKQPL